MSENKGVSFKRIEKPTNIERMDLFDYRRKIGTLNKTGLGCLNQSGWLIKNENGSETWVSEKQYNKIKDLCDWLDS